MTTTYQIVDGMTGQVVGGEYPTAKRARSRCDRLDIAYGSCRYYVRAVAAG